MGGFATARAGVGGACGMLPDQVHPCEKAFVAQTAPQRPADLGVIAPTHPSPLDSPSPAFRLERFERFARNEVGSPHARQQDQHIGRQMGKARCCEPRTSSNSAQSPGAR